MEPHEFPAEVLPPPGNGKYCVVELTKKKEHFYVDTLEQALPKIDAWKQQGLDVYFALGTFGDLKRRIATNVRMVRCIAVDVDCSHPKDIPDENGEVSPKAYPSAKAAAHAIMQFSDEVGLSGLGNPWLVASGGGVHAYWPFTEAVDIDEWKPVAEGFKRLCFQKKLGIDQTITADASRVLRVFDTVNNGVKGTKKVREVTQVKFKNAGDHFVFTDIRTLVEKHLVGTAYEVSTKSSGNKNVSLAGKRGNYGPSEVKLFENSVTKFRKIVDLTKEGRGCDQLAYYVNNAKDDGLEPLWRGLLSITQKCADGEKAALWLSDKHPYDHDRMYRKLAEIKGPYPCTKFDSENPGVCVGCSHWGKITNPLALGREVDLVTQETVVETIGEDAQIVQVKRPEPPKGYAYGKHGGIFMEKTDEDANGNEIKRQVMLLPFDLFPVDILNINGEHTIHMTALRPTGAVVVTLPQKAVVSKDDTLKNLANQNVLAAFGAGNDKNLFDYIRAVVEKLSGERPPIKVPAHYGWQPDDSFVFAGAIYSPHKEPVTVPMPGLENIISSTIPTGTLGNWCKFIELLIARKMWDLLAVVLHGAGAPLMRFTGLDGATLHCASTESGTGKSLALAAQASVFGHPTRYRTGSGTSAVAMQNRLGLLHSLPFISDEITTNNHKDFEWFPAFVFSVSEGQGKERMESGTNRERLNQTTWATNASLSSNTHAVDWMTGARTFASNGELLRMIEFVMEEKLDFSQEEVEIIKSLSENYGVAGDVYVQFMVDNLDKIKELVPETVRRMYDEYKATNDERFWMADIGCAVAAGILFSSKFASIIDIPLEPIIESFCSRIHIQRTAIKGGKRSAEDVLNAFISEHYGHFVIVKMDAKSHVLAHLGDNSAVDKFTTRNTVMGRIEHGVTSDCVDFFIEERLLKAYCSNMSYGYAAFKREIEKAFVVSYVQRKDMMARTSGPPMRVTAMRIIRRIDGLDEKIAHPVALAQS
jgi:hypothetical protein